LIAGKLSGYKFMSFRVYSILFVKEDGKLVIKKFSVPGTAGQCLMIPPDPVNGEFPYKLYNLGGSLMNFIMSGLFTVLLVFSLPFYAVLLLITFLAVGFGIGLMNILPLKIGGVATDGYNVSLLNKCEETRAAFRVMLVSNAYMAAGMRYKDMPAEWSELPDDFNNPIIVTTALLRYNYLCDIKNLTEAKLLAERILNETDKILEIHKNLLRCEIMFLEIVGECRKEEIERLYTNELKKAVKASAGLISVQRLLYAYEKLVTLDETAAKKAFERFEKICKKYPYAGDAEMEREMIGVVDEVYGNR
jgi:hypothetical protein